MLRRLRKQGHRQHTGRTAVTDTEANPRRQRPERLRSIPARVAGWRPGRKSAIAALIALPALGAVIAAATHSSSGYRFKAQATVVADATARGIPARARQLERAQVMAEAAALPQVIAAARITTAQNRSVEEIADHVSASVRPGSAIVRITVEEASEARAVALANSIAAQTLAFIERLATTGVDGRTVVGDFEAGPGEWGVRQSVFNTPARIVGQDTSEARFGQASLRAECPATPACGPVLRLYGRFEQGVTYSVAGFARSDRLARVGMLLGATGEDYATGDYRTLQPGWKPLAASWTPQADHSVVEIGFQTATARTTAYNIDGVTLFDPLASPSGEPLRESRSSARRALERAEYAAVAGARPTGQVDESSRTAAWALGGALGGLAVALAAITLGRASRRRRQHP